MWVRVLSCFLPTKMLKIFLVSVLDQKDFFKSGGVVLQVGTIANTRYTQVERPRRPSPTPSQRKERKTRKEEKFFFYAICKKI